MLGHKRATNMNRDPTFALMEENPVVAATLASERRRRGLGGCDRRANSGLNASKT